MPLVQMHSISLHFERLFSFFVGNTRRVRGVSLSPFVCGHVVNGQHVSWATKKFRTQVLFSRLRSPFLVDPCGVQQVASSTLWTL